MTLDNQGSQKPVEELREELFAKADVMDSEARSHLKNWIVSTVGVSLESLERDPNHIQQLLESTDDEVRDCALSYIATFYPFPNNFSAIFKRIASCDSSFRVRDSAIYGLTLIYFRFRDEEIKKVLYIICNNPKENDDVRKSAYLALIMIDNATGKRINSPRRSSFSQLVLDVMSRKGIDDIIDFDRLRQIIEG